MKKIIYFLMLILFVIFSWLYKEPGENNTSGQEKNSKIQKVNYRRII